MRIGALFMLETTEQIDPEQFIASLQKNYSNLSVRIRELTHSVKCETDGLDGGMPGAVIAEAISKQATVNPNLMVGAGLRI